MVIAARRASLTRSGASEIWVCKSDGSSPRALTDLRRTSGNPSWSPDGRLIAFDGENGGSSDLCVISSDGGAPRQLTRDASAEAMPSWSRDG